MKTGLFFLLLGLTTNLLSQEIKVPSFTRMEYLPDWKDSDQNCRDTRNEVLMQTSLIPVHWIPGKTNCEVQSGKWADPFSGDTLFAAEKVKIMHLVGLREAHQSGAWRWPREKKQLFANSYNMERQLVPVAFHTYQSRNDEDPSVWLPSETGFIVDYVRHWTFIKVAWDLNADRAELVRIKGLLPKPHPKLPEESPEALDISPESEPTCQIICKPEETACGDVCLKGNIPCFEPPGTACNSESVK